MKLDFKRKGPNSAPVGRRAPTPVEREDTVIDLEDPAPGLAAGSRPPLPGPSSSLAGPSTCAETERNGSVF